MMERCCAAPTAMAVKPWRLYRPLIIALALSMVLSAANVSGGIAMAGGAWSAKIGWGSAMTLMDGTMGLFMLMLGCLQARSLRSFADLFAAYDPLAKRLRAYALAYPFLTITLGLAYLLGVWPMATNICTLAIMTASAVGVAGVLQSGRTLSCACAGTGFSLPVGKVTLAEYGLMAAMAALNLLTRAA